MPTPFSSLLRGVNRVKNDKLNILLINHDEQFQEALSKTNNNFFLLSLPNLRQWDRKVRDIPSNFRILAGNSIQEQIKIDLAIDLIISQNRHEQYPILSQISKQMSCPIISFDNHLYNVNMNQFYVRNLSDQIYNHNIFCSKFAAESWGFDSGDTNISIISKCINTDIFNTWNGSDGHILTMVDLYEQKGKMTGFQLWMKLKQKFKMNPWGNCPGLCNPASNIQKRLQLYKNCSVFLDTSFWSCASFELLEAMSCGCPVVVTKIGDHSDLIENGVNGFITNNENEIDDYLTTLLNNKKLAKELGDNAKKTVLEKFNLDIFSNEVDSIFRQYIDKPCSLLVN